MTTDTSMDMMFQMLSRERLDPIHEAQLYRDIRDTYGLSQNSIASHLGVSEAEISNKLRLLKLPQLVRDLIAQRELTAGHGKPLCALSHDEAIELAKRAVENKWTARFLEQQVRTIKLHKYSQL